MKRADSTFDPITIEGEWRLASTPDVRIRGKLSGTLTDDVYLSTEGNLGDDFHARDANMIVLGESRSGERITLLQCFSTKRSGSFDRSKADANYFVHWIIIGEHFGSYDELMFDRMYFGISSLEEWHDVRSFDVRFDPQARVATVAYTNPAPIPILKSKGIAATLEYSYKPSDQCIAQQSATIEHAARINLQCESASPLYECKEGMTNSLFTYATQISSFLEFAIGSQIYLYDITVYSSKFLESLDSRYKRPIKVLRIMSAPSQRGPVPFHKMLFTWARVKDNPQKYLHAWLNIVCKIGSPLALYLGSFRRDVFQYQRFVELALGLEGFHRYLFPESSVKSPEHEAKIADILAACPKEYQTWLKERLQYSHEPSFRRRLKDLFERYKEILCWFTGSWANAKEFIDLIVDNRNQYAHCLNATDMAFTSDVRQRTIRVMQLVFAMLLLEQSEFTQQEINSIIRDNWAYSQLQKRAT